MLGIQSPGSEKCEDEMKVEEKTGNANQNNTGDAILITMHHDMNEVAE
jgi:hypothetical protein